MGDRAVVLFANEHGQLEPYATYFHWAGADGVIEIAKAALTKHRDRADDVSYFAARFVAAACEDSPGSTGVGLLGAPEPEKLTDADYMKEYSHGDAGVCIFTPSNGTVSWIDGTGYGKGEIALAEGAQ